MLFKSVQAAKLNFVLRNSNDFLSQRTGAAYNNRWLVPVRKDSPQHCRSCSDYGSCDGVRGLAGDGAEVPLAVACPGEEGDCPALECGENGCYEAMLSCPDDRRCPVPANAPFPAKLPTLLQLL